jgi:hypothetical protein
LLRFHNWLTRQFTIEYGALFDGLLPALDRLRAPRTTSASQRAYRAIWQFMTDRFAWEKTKHGVSHVIKRAVTP